MIYITDAYKTASNKSERKSYIIAKYGQFDKKIKSSISSVQSSNSQMFSNNDKTYNDIKETNYNYITCEPNRVKLDNSFFFISNKEKSNVNEKIAFYSDNLSNENSATSTTITYTLNSYYSIIDVVLYFQEVCSNIKVSFYNDDTLICDVPVNDNTLKIVNFKINDEYIGSLFNKLEILVTKTEEPYRYVKLNEIDFGSFKTITNDEIIDLNIIDELSIDSSELSSNSLSLTIDDTKQEYNILNPKNKLSLLQEKQEITVYHYLKVFDTYKELPLGTFLLKDFKSSRNKLQIEAYDTTYFMNKMYYGSKFYKDTSATDILKDIFNYFNFTNYIIGDELNTRYLTGYVPIVEFREAIRMVAEASFSVVKKDRYGKIVIFYKSYNDKTLKRFEKRLQFNENHEKNLFNNIIDITDYSYKELISQEVYNSKLSYGEHIIIFNKFPILPETLVKSVENNSYEIKEIYATSCVVKVLSTTDVILNATLMEQSSNVKRFKKDETLTQEEYTINKINNTLISSATTKSVSPQHLANWKFKRGDIKFRFDTLLLPYIEVGDTCGYRTNFETIPDFIVTKIEYNKSLKQNIEGE